MEMLDGSHMSSLCLLAQLISHSVGSCNILVILSVGLEQK